ncbi:MAG: hypothetical protein ACOCWH_00330 [Spirochaetota bacterium]
MKKHVVLAVIKFCHTASPLVSASVSPLQMVIAKEDSSYHRNNINEIMKKTERRYGNLYGKLKAGGRLTIFFDPAHGLLRSQNWQGNVTWRQSTTDKPEEFYSIPLSRNLYRYLVSNRYIKVASTRNFLEMLRGERDTYYNILFSTTTKLADETDSFMIISSHLNNVDPAHKADGRVNMYGIHVTCDKYGTRFISHVKHVSRGFLTLYNVYDGSGFSRTYAEKLKQELIGIDMYPNGWGKGVVPDGRFSYFSNYPVSVIYETAFISNPVEERFLRIPRNQRLIAKAQYESLIDSIKAEFGVDISGSSVRQHFKQPKELVESIALSQIAIYYIKNHKYDEAVYACRLTARTSKNKSAKAYYTSVADRLEKASKYIASAEKNRKNKQAYGTYMLKAIKKLGSENVFSAMRSDLYTKRNKRLGIRPSRDRLYKRKLGAPPRFRPLPVAKESHTYKTPYILTIKPGQTLKDAIAKAIAPHNGIREKVYASFDDVRVTEVKWERKYSNRKKKYYWQKKQYSARKTFEPGIYIIYLNGDYTVQSVKNVERVEFDPKKYQNQEYFKNSSLAAKEMLRSL